MPIVFVHGVANRRGKGYEQTFASISKYLLRYVAPAISDDPDGVTIVDAFWGDLGATFAWDRASRPRTPLLGMGADATPEAARLQTYAQFYDQLHEIPVAESASTLNTGGLISAGAGTVDVRLSDLPPQELSDLAAAIIDSLAGADDDVATATIVADELAFDEDFRDELAAIDSEGQMILFSDAVASSLEAESGLVGMGIGWIDGLKDRLGEVFERGKKSPGWAASRVLLEARRPLHNVATVFLGDIFEYLQERGKAGEPGAIAERVVSKLVKAAEISSQRSDEPIIVVSHSMGGQIVYDILTEFLPNGTTQEQSIHVSLWCAAASQVGLFEELKLFEASDSSFSKENNNKVPFPGSNLSSWWNVWDSNDILSFRADEIFEGIDDEEYSSGTSLISAHSGYFDRPSFFRRLALKTRAAVKDA